MLATWYLCGQPMAMDPLSLETLGAETFLDTLHGDVMAHPKLDERTGELMWFDYGTRDPLLRYGVVGRPARSSTRSRSICRGRGCRTTWRSPRTSRC